MWSVSGKGAWQIAAGASMIRWQIQGKLVSEEEPNKERVESLWIDANRDRVPLLLWGDRGAIQQYLSSYVMGTKYS